MTQKLAVEYRSTGDLIPYARNSRTHSEAQVAQIAASIREFGFTNPVLLDEQGGIIAGHGRVEAARKLALGEVPCIVLAGLTEAQKRAYVIADNRLALNAGWDNEMLAAEFADLMEAGFDLSLTGFGEGEIESLLRDDGGAQGLTGDDDVPDAGGPTATAAGDIWVCGDHRLICGDATEKGTIFLVTAGELVDLYLTDPPYNVAYEGKTKDALKIKNDSMNDAKFREFLSASFSAADSQMKPGASFYIWHADLEGFNFRGACRDAGWTVRQCLVWQKSTMVLGRQDYQWRHEPCLYGWKDGAAHLWASDRKQTTVLEFAKPQRNGEHPTMKPVELFSYQMLNNTRGQDLVLDSFGGSGTTMIAAETHGRRARLVELDPIYCDVIVRRWQAFTGKSATLLESGKTFDEVCVDRGVEKKDDKKKGRALLA